MKYCCWEQDGENHWVLYEAGTNFYVGYVIKCDDASKEETWESVLTVSELDYRIYNGFPDMRSAQQNLEEIVRKHNYIVIDERLQNLL